MRKRKRQSRGLLSAAIDVDRGLVDGSFLWWVARSRKVISGERQMVRCPLIPDGCEFEGFVTSGGAPEIDAFRAKYFNQLRFVIASCGCKRCVCHER